MKAKDFSKKISKKFKKFGNKKLNPKLSLLVHTPHFLKTIFWKTTTRKLFTIYFIILLLGSALLYTPISFNNFYENGVNYIWSNGGYFQLHYNKLVVDASSDISSGGIVNVAHLVDTTVNFSFIDAMFTAFSGFSDTGLIVAPTLAVFSAFGQIMIALLIQLGGFGVVAIIYLFWLLTASIVRNKKMSMGDFRNSFDLTLMAQAEKGNTKIGQTSTMLKWSVLWIFVTEVVFMIFYTFWFYFSPALLQAIPTGDLAGQHFTYALNANTQIDISHAVNISSSAVNNMQPIGDPHVSGYKNVGLSIWQAIFHSIASINNAGFDIVGNSSLASYRDNWDTIFLLVTMLEFIIGGIGFPILFDLHEKKYRFKMIVNGKETKIVHIVSTKLDHRLSLFTKLSLASYFGVTIFSLIGGFVFEFTPIGGGENLIFNAASTQFGASGQSSSLEYYNKSCQVIFQTISTRSAGFATVNNDFLNPTTKWFYSFLMFVGGSPSSTAGGIRTTTLAICFLSLFAKLRGSNDVTCFKRRIDKNTVTNSYVVFISAFGLICITAVICIFGMSASDVNNQIYGYDFTNAFYEACSAFGTTGLSTGVSASTNAWGKVFLMLLMFIGQMGISSTILSFNSRKANIKNRFLYPKEGVKIG